MVGLDLVHRRNPPWSARYPPTSTWQAEARAGTGTGGVRPKSRRSGRDPSAFGRNVEDIIAEVEWRNGLVDQAAPAVSVQHSVKGGSDEVLSPVHLRERLDGVGVAPKAKNDVRSAGPWQWVMFAEPASGGVEFLGVYVTRAFSGDHAVYKAHVTGNCPGGYADIVALPGDIPIDPDHLDRLLTLNECEALRERLGRLSN